MGHKTTLTLSILCLWASFCYAQQNSCDNIGFESGNFNGWKLEYGHVSTSFWTGSTIYSTPISGTFQQGHLIMSGVGNDPNITVENIPVVAPGSIFSARIGNDINGSFYDRISRTVTVTPDNSLFVYQFAIILQNPDPKTHTPAQQPKFLVKILDPSGNSDDCNTYEVYASTKNKGFKSQGTGDKLLVYRNWTTAALDLRAYLGQTITITVTSSDCTEGGHYGYAYFDAQCLSSKITASSACASNSSLTLKAPEGFETYTWNTGDTTNPLVIKNPVAGTKYTVKVKPFYSISDSCLLTLDYTLQNLLPSATSLIKTSCNPSDTGTVVQRLTNVSGCDSVVTIKTTLLKGRDTTFLTATTCDPTVSSTAIKRYTNFVGCDSFVQLKTILLRGRDTTFINSTTCSPIDTGTTLRKFTNFVGCDSFIRQKISLLKGRDTTFLAAASCNPADTGIVFKRYTNFVGCDSFVSKKTALLKGRDTTFLTSYTCISTDTVNAILKKQNINGCDSFIYFRKKYYPLTMEFVTSPSDCSGKSGNISIIKTAGKPPYKYALQDTVNYQVSAIFSNLSGQTYTVFVKDSLNCVHQFDSIQVKDSECNVFIPNVFSPNFDNTNDKFVFYTSSKYIKTIKTYRIFNRWGILVYEAPSKNVAYEQFNEWWDGTFKKEYLAPDVFIYAIEVEYFDETITNKVLKGDVTLVR